MKLLLVFTYFFVLTSTTNATVANMETVYKGKLPEVMEGAWWEDKTDCFVMLNIDIRHVKNSSLIVIKDT